MRNSITISSIANVISRFSVKATVMLRDGNTEPATWPHCAGPINGRSKRGMLEPVLLGDASSLILIGRYSGGNRPAGILQPYAQLLRFLQPALRQSLFQRIS